MSARRALLLIVALLALTLVGVFVASGYRDDPGGTSPPHSVERAANEYQDSPQPGYLETELRNTSGAPGPDVPTADDSGPPVRPAQPARQAATSSSSPDRSTSAPRPSQQPGSATLRLVDADVLIAAAQGSELRHGQVMSDDDYLRIAASDSRDRERANAKYVLEFNTWPGRDSGRMGGLTLDPAELATLRHAGYALVSDRVDPAQHIQVGQKGLPPGYVFEVSRETVFANEAHRITCVITVAVSAGWAHETLLQVALGTSPGVGTREDPMWRKGVDIGLPLGDVALFFGPSPRSSGHRQVRFTRNNLFVGLQATDLGGRPAEPEIDLYALALEFDRKITAEAVLASGYEDLRAQLPVVTACHVEPGVPAADMATIHFEAAPSHGTRLHIGWRAPDERLTLGRVDAQGRFAPHREPNIILFRPGTEAAEQRLWVAIVGENLLWTVAEATFTAPEVKLPYDPNARPEPPWRTK